MFFIVKKISSYLPFLSCSDDSNFGELKKRSENFRFSLLRISLGINKFYFLTFKKEDGFKFFHKLNLYEIQKESDNDEIDKKGNAYEELIKNKLEDEVELQIKVLEHKIKQNEDRSSKSLNKMMFYNAIGLIIITFLISVLKEPVLVYWKLVIVFFLLYFLLNIYLFLFSFMKVSDYFRFRFKEIKEDTKIKVLAKGLYKEWWSENNKGVLYVTYVKNVEKYFVYTMFSIGIFVLIMFSCKIQPIVSSNVMCDLLKNQSNYSVTNRLVYDLSLNEKGFFNQSRLKGLNKINEELLEGVVEKIIVLRNGKNCSVAKYKKILELIFLHNVKKVPVIEIDLNATIDSKDNYISIISLKEK